MSAPDFDRAVNAARVFSPPPTDVAATLATVQRRALLPRETAPRPLWSVSLVLAGVALSGLVFVWLMPPREQATVVQPALTHHAATSPVRVGERVVLLASNASDYRVREVSATRTVLALRHGAITVRLFAGASPYELQVSAADVTAAAIGTIYSVQVDASGKPAVFVHEGVVRVTSPEDTRELRAGTHWPEQAEPSIELPAHVAALATLTAELPETPAPHATEAKPRVDPAELWQRARDHRARGDTQAALRVLDELGRHQDTTWTPIALAEQIRVLALMRRDVEIPSLAEAFLARYGDHDLASNVRALLCDAKPSACDDGAPKPGTTTDTPAR